MTSVEEVRGQGRYHALSPSCCPGFRRVEMHGCIDRIAELRRPFHEPVGRLNWRAGCLLERSLHRLHELHIGGRSFLEVFL